MQYKLFIAKLIYCSSFPSSYNNTHRNYQNQREDTVMTNTNHPKRKKKDAVIVIHTTT